MLGLTSLFPVPDEIFKILNRRHDGGGSDGKA